MPKVSVIMSVYNDEKYLKESIDSILGQSFSDFEFIILNDGSIDNSEKIIKDYNDDRVVYIKNEKNIGLAASLNKGIKLAKGEYIARMDADDISLPERLQKQVDFLDNNQKFGVVGSWIKFFGDKSEVIKFHSSTLDTFYSFLTGRVMVSHPVAMFRKAVVINNNIFYDETLKTAQDYKFWNDLKYVTLITNLKEVLLHYRVHSKALTSLKRSEQKNNKFRIIKEEFEKNIDKKFKKTYRNLLEDVIENVSFKDLKEYLNVIKFYKNRNFKKKLIFKFLKYKVKNRNKKFQKIIAIFYLRPFMIYYIIKG